MSTESSPCHSKEPDLEEAGKRISGYVGSRATEDEMGAVKPIENSPEMLSRSIHIRERQERAGMRYSGKVLRHRTCRVPSCHADLSTGKKFNVRYRICEEHRTCQEVLVDGQDQRFCQMCARFHTLDNFDGGFHYVILFCFQSGQHLMFNQNIIGNISTLGLQVRK